MEVKHLYHYNALVTSVYDGDTCTVDIDLGMGTWIRGEKIRLYRINTPEVRGDSREEGLISRDFLRNIVEGKTVLLRTVKDKKGKYGRYLGDIWIQDEAGNQVCVNDILVSEGLAEYKDY